MSVPLDRLYHYIEDIARDLHGNNVVIYHFFPHGSKNIENLTPLYYSDWSNTVTSPAIYCNDQEPLDWNFYNDEGVYNSKWAQLCLDNSLEPTILNNLCRFVNFYGKNILLHSEQRSAECDLYQKNNFIPAYYWSHAVIARDWFRFANYVDQKKSSNKKFLIYNRAWSGTREYRLKFADLLIDNGLVDQCQTSVSFADSHVHYQQYNFKNSQWKPCNNLEDFFIENFTTSCYSADFDLADYNNTDIEVVLETLFDDSRLHLTEKSLRPIACGQPFVLAATHGSLGYLRRYGFKTYDSVWNEDYDSIQDPVQRLNAIVNLMNDIASWDSLTQEYKLKQAQTIADYNKKYFFSEEFSQLIIDELRQNLSTAINEANKNINPEIWLDRRQQLCKVDEIRQVLTAQIPFPDYDKNPKFWSSMTRENIAKVVAKAVKITKSKQPY